MESDGAMELFHRSGNNRNLIDGTYGMPYGPLVYINKEECRTHITKRMGTGLRTIVKNYKGMFCWSNFFSQPHVLKFSNKLILLEFQIMVVVEVVS